ncbi:hypothetical protein DES40_1030 [Litorimonas taeanensis]|uniref:Uncharacterized protein n=1 Tax=Litorimonas taeanensis TaxID=568099 RepID=A0A420WLB5_9PROT|nr:hypothetical protein [Litorimonas taeanensis]RKQ71702.1 hypothetical protein DES40_1030 [Litorimonas taeanensis]
MTKSLPLDLAAIFMFVGAVFHIACLFGGADWLLFAGAPAAFAEAYRQGAVSPIYWTVGIAVMLVVWGLYALSAAQRIRPLPVLKIGVALIGTLMFLRGIIGLGALVLTDWPWDTAKGQFHAIASFMIFGVGLFYYAGLIALVRAKKES